MCEVIAIVNQKGGVGKSTTSILLSNGLKRLGKKTLLVDCDPQCNSSKTYGALIDGYCTIYDMIAEDADINECIQKTENGDIIAGDKLMYNAEKIFPNDASRNFIFSEKMECLRSEYDYIIIDTPPSLNISMLNCVTFSDSVIIPVLCDEYSIDGLVELHQTLINTKKYTNPKLKTKGILMNMYAKNQVLSKKTFNALQPMCELFETKIFDAKIRQSNACKESQVNKVMLYDYKKKNNTSIDYMKLCKELVGA